MTFCSQPKIRPASVLGGETTLSCFIAPVKTVHLWSYTFDFTGHKVAKTRILSKWLTKLTHLRCALSLFLKCLWFLPIIHNKS